MFPYQEDIVPVFQNRKKVWILKRHCSYLNKSIPRCAGGKKPRLWQQYLQLQETHHHYARLPLLNTLDPFRFLWKKQTSHASSTCNIFSEATDYTWGLRVKYLLRLWLGWLLNTQARGSWWVSGLYLGRLFCKHLRLWFVFPIFPDSRTFRTC